MKSKILYAERSRLPVIPVPFSPVLVPLSFSLSLSLNTLPWRPHPLLPPPKLKCTYLSRPTAANAQSNSSVASPGQRSAPSEVNSPSNADGYRIHYLCEALLLRWEHDVRSWGAGELVFLAWHKQPEEALLLKSFMIEQWPCCTSRPRKQALPNSSQSLLMCCTWSGSHVSLFQTQLYSACSAIQVISPGV